MSDGDRVGDSRRGGRPPFFVCARGLGALGPEADVGFLDRDPNIHGIRALNSIRPSDLGLSARPPVTIRSLVDAGLVPHRDCGTDKGPRNHNIRGLIQWETTICCGWKLVPHTGCLSVCVMPPTALTLDVLEIHGQHGSIPIRVQVRVHSATPTRRMRNSTGDRVNRGTTAGGRSVWHVRLLSGGAPARMFYSSSPWPMGARDRRWAD
jgi:hypothetical protein